MRTLLGFLLLLTLSVVVGLFIVHDPGYVLVTYGAWILEMPLWLAAFSLILLTYLLCLFARFGRSINQLATNVSKYARKRTRRKFKKVAARGFIELAEGRWHQAEKNLSASGQLKESSLMSYLGAAIAAQEQGENSRREEYLRLAYQCNSGAELAIGITQAKLQFTEQQFEQCLATLERLSRLAPSHQYVMQLLQQVYEKLHDWERLVSHLHLMKKRRIMTKAAYDSALKSAHFNLLQRLSQRKSEWGAWEKAWKKLPEPFKTEANFLALYLPMCCQHAPEQAEVLLRLGLKKQWSDELVKFYGQLRLPDTRQQLQQCEKWLKQTPENSVLLLTLGRLCSHAQLWGKAELYLNSSLQNRPTAEAYYELGKIHATLGNSDKAGYLFQAGLALATDNPLFDVKLMPSVATSDQGGA